MSHSVPHRVVTRVFGADGDVILDAETQVMVLASSILVTASTILSPLIADLSVVFGVSEARAGLLILAFTSTLVVAIPLMGIAADRFGRRVVFVPGLTGFGISGAAIGLVESFPAAIALRMLQAVGFAASMPIAIALLGDLYEDSRETTAQGVRVATVNVAVIGLPFLSGVLFVYSWRAPFALYLLAVPLAVWAWFVLPDVDPDHGGSLKGYLEDLAGLLRRPAMALLAATFIIRFVMLLGFFTYVSVLVTRSIGLSVVVAGSVISVKGAMALLSSTQVGRLANRVRPTVMLAGAFLVTGAGMAIMGLIPSLPTLVAGVMVFGIGDGIISPGQKSFVNRLSPMELRTGAVSVTTTFQNVGKVIGPAVLGVLLGIVGPGSAFVIVGVVSGLLGTTCMLGALRFRSGS